MEQDQKSRSQNDRRSSMPRASGQWEFLKGKFEAGQLGHAYLFSGPKESHKEDFAKEFTAFINKGIGGSDLPIEKEQFPDLLVVKSQNSDSSIKNEKDMMEIDVAQIREVNNFLSLKSYYGGFKTVIIENAERMNTEAQNSFLKTLEEPKGSTLIILISSKPELLLPTIFSRCQTITFFPTQKYSASTEQKKLLQELLPVISSELAIKFQYAKKVNLEGDNFAAILEALQRYFRNEMLVKIGVVKQQEVSSYSLEKLKKIINLIERLHQQMLTANANAKLALEILLMEI